MKKNVGKQEDIIPNPGRPADYLSKRSVEYWWAPEWVRNLNGSICRIKPVKYKGTVELHMISKSGNSTKIQGSIQREFRKWHEDMKIDYMLLGGDEENLIKPEWEKKD